MEQRFRIKPKLSFTPGKTVDSVYRVRLGKKAGHHQQADIWEALDSGRKSSLSPRKGKPSTMGLFRGARLIDGTETYLLQEKTHRLSNTKESSSPQESKGHEQARLTKPLGMARNNRSMSGGKI